MNIQDLLLNTTIKQELLFNAPANLTANANNNWKVYASTLAKELIPLYVKLWTNGYVNEWGSQTLKDCIIKDLKNTGLLQVSTKILPKLELENFTPADLETLHNWIDEYSEKVENQALVLEFFYNVGSMIADCLESPEFDPIFALYGNRTKPIYIPIHSLLNYKDKEAVQASTDGMIYLDTLGDTAKPLDFLEAQIIYHIASLLIGDISELPAEPPATTTTIFDEARCAVHYVLEHIAECVHLWENDLKNDETLRFAILERYEFKQPASIDLELQSTVERLLTQAVSNPILDELFEFYDNNQRHRRACNVWQNASLNANLIGSDGKKIDEPLPATIFGTKLTQFEIVLKS